MGIAFLDPNLHFPISLITNLPHVEHLFFFAGQ